MRFIKSSAAVCAAAASLLVATAPAVAAPFAVAGPGAFSVDTNPGTNVVLTSAQGGTITDLNVSVYITGGHMEDFDLFLTSPTGTTVQFRSDFFDPFSHIDNPLQATFDDEAATPHSAQASGGVGTFQAFNLLSAFDGEELLGNWTLTITDEFVPGEGNELVSWSISGTVASAVPEPGTLALAGLALLGLGAARRRSR